MANEPLITLDSPDGDLHLGVALTDAGSLRWWLSRGNAEHEATVIRDAALSIEFDTASFVSGLRIVSTAAPAEREFAFSMPHGKRRESRALATECTIIVANADGVELAVDLVVFNDGAAHRFRTLADASLRLVSDTTAFVFDPDGVQYGQVYDRVGFYTPASESVYTGPVPIGSEFPASAGWAFPMLFQTGEDWTLLTESGVDHRNHGSRLDNGINPGEFVILGPTGDQGEGPESLDGVSGPWTLPWKVIITSTDLGVVVGSDLAHLVAPETTMMDTSWIRPGRVSWSWWSESDSPTDPAALRSFIDLAADMGWEYSLIDANWNKMPDGTIEELVAYADERNVGIFLWYNSGGDHTEVAEEPKGRMLTRDVRRTEMAWMRDLGIIGAKVDFFQSDKQSMNALSWDILADAADFQLLMNFHGVTSPKAWSRTWPHLMTQEGVRGAEQYKFDPKFPAAAARHNTILAFTRNVVAPMDYTPITLSDVDFPHLTTYAHELALGVVFESALQHPADGPAAYRALPAEAQAYLRDLPAVWDDIVLLDGEPGSHIVLARRFEDRWWIGALNGTAAEMTVTVDLSSLTGCGDLTLGTDADTPRALAFREPDSAEFTVAMAPFGGFFACPR